MSDIPVPARIPTYMSTIDSKFKQNCGMFHASHADVLKPSDRFNAILEELTNSVSENTLKP